VPDHRSVPDDARWRIAARHAARLAAMYQQVFFPVLSDRYDELEQEVWIQMAQFSGEIARSLRFPVGTARELAESLRSVNTIVFGPDCKEEVIDVGNDGAVIIIRRCPHVTGEVPYTEHGTFHRCMACTLSSQKALNPAYSARFVRAMCMGDRQCEIRIEPEEEPEKKAEKKAAGENLQGTGST